MDNLRNVCVDLDVDLFAHSGTVNRVCRRLDLDCIGIDISPFYCRKIAKETGAELVMHESAPKNPTLFSLGVAGQNLLGRRTAPSHSIFRRFRPGCQQVREQVWYEDAEGRRQYINWDDVPSVDPQEYPYQVSRFPCVLHTDHLRIKEDRSSELVCAFGNSWSEDLALALTLKAGYRLADAIVIAAVSCERCANSMAYALGLDWGYAEGSEEWSESGTECEWCQRERAQVQEVLSSQGG